MIRAVLNAGETILTEMIDWVRHQTRIISISLVDIVNAMSDASTAVQASITASDLKLPYLTKLPRNLKAGYKRGEIPLFL
jgi:hypothetical protein